MLVEVEEWVGRGFVESLSCILVSLRDRLVQVVGEFLE
jgi:hypothetical protein